MKHPVKADIYFDGRSLIRWLESLGYQVVRQRGSHVRLERYISGGTHAITVQRLPREL